MRCCRFSRKEIVMGKEKVMERVSDVASRVLVRITGCSSCRCV